jgi:hypothetical protein
MDAKFEFTPNPGAREQILAAIFEATQEVFELDIKPDAVENSPVRTGTNRRSIDTATVPDDATATVTATLFTQSGYGGYLELGTSKMKAMPYLYPAWSKFRDKIAQLVAAKLASKQ